MKPKTKKGQVKRQTAKRPKASAATTDLLKIADKVAIQRDIARAISLKTAERARRAVMENDMQSAGSQILVWQAIRTANPKLVSAAFAVIDSMAEDAARSDARLEKLYQASEAKHREAGFGEDEEWPEDKRPPEIQALFDEYWDRLHQLKVAFLRLHGEDEMADLLANDPEAYQARIDQAEEEGKDREKWRAEIDAGFSRYLNSN